MTLKNNEFFDQLADDYDEMINFENAVDNKTKTLAKFIKPHFKFALDLGCGSGADSIVLSKLGLEVDAVDHSAGMLEQAVKNSKHFKTKINFIQSGLTDFSVSHKSFDIIVSLGNTLANLKRNELGILLKNLYPYLNNGGNIVIQIINYAKLPTSGTFTLHTFENDSVIITRKYNINADDIDFIIDKTDKNKKIESQIITKLYPHSANDFKKFAKEIGFSLAIYGDLNKSPFKEKESSNLVAVLTK